MSGQIVLFKPTDDEVKRTIRQNLAAAVSLLQRPDPDDDLEEVMHLMDLAWRQVAALMVRRDLV